MKGPALPLISEIQVLDSTPLHPRKETYYKVKLVPAGCLEDIKFVASESLISSYGRPWTATMMAEYAVMLAPLAVDQEHHLHRYCKEQLLELASFEEQVQAGRRLWQGDDA